MASIVGTNVQKNTADAAKFPKRFEWTDLAYALDNAAEFLENEEWPERDGGAQLAANQEAAKRIRKMSARLVSKQAKQE